MTASRDLSSRASRVIPGGVNSGQRRIAGLEDLAIATTAGAEFVATDGRRYVDFHAAFGPPLLGHNDPDVDRAAAAEARRNSLMGVGVTPIEVELAERIVELVASVEQVLLTVTGSEATFHALRLARAVTGRRHVIKAQGCYHGWHDAVALNVISPAERVGARDPLSAGILPEVLAATTVVPFNDADAIGAAIDALDGDVAAVILEPIPHNIGCVLPRDGYLQAVRDICTRRGVVFVLDEVITGFRHGLGGYQAIAGVQPDLTCFGKAIANGYPISALGGRRDLMEQFSTTPGRPAFFAGTFNGHPGMAAAALATLDKLRREPVHEHVFALGARARRELQALYDGLEVPARVAGFGSVFVSYFLDRDVTSYDDLLANDVDLFCGYRHGLREHGVFELPLNLKRSHVSYAHTDAHIDQLLEATALAVRAQLDRRRAWAQA